MLRRLWLLLFLLRRRFECASVRRPSVVPDILIDFEDMPQICDFAQASVLFNDYAADMVQFSGPGFGGASSDPRTVGDWQ